MNTFIHQYASVLVAVAAYVVLAAVNALPDPATQQFEIYPWLYHTAKSLLNAVPASYKAKVLPAAADGDRAAFRAALVTGALSRNDLRAAVSAENQATPPAAS